MSALQDLESWPQRGARQGRRLKALLEFIAGSANQGGLTVPRLRWDDDGKRADVQWEWQSMTPPGCKPVLVLVVRRMLFFTYFWLACNPVDRFRLGLAFCFPHCLANHAKRRPFVHFMRKKWARMSSSSALGSVSLMEDRNRKGGEEKGNSEPEFSGLDFEFSCSWQEIRWEDAAFFYWRRSLVTDKL